MMLTTGRHDDQPRPSPARAALLLAAAMAALLAALPTLATDRPATGSQTRGAYLAAIMDCRGCHTPGTLMGKPDAARDLAGSEIGFQVPELGIFYPPNLTSDPETGLGRWSEAEIARAVRTGVRPDGRILAPVMPWHAYAALTDEDAAALAGYLKSLPPVRNAVPPLTGPSEAPPAPYFTIVAPRG
jgi:mono/diheme cytochrome c family protein